MPAWNSRILIDSIDRTSSVSLDCSVIETENASSLADFTYTPPAGVQDSDALQLQSVLIEIDMKGSWDTLFSGRIIRAIWDPKSKTYAIRASDQLQEHIRALGSEDAVLAALPGAAYSDAIQGEPPQDLWEYCERALESVQYEIHLDRTGTLVQSQWAAKATADIALDCGDLHNNGAFELIRPSADQLINQVVIEYQHRLTRRKVRTHTVSFSITTCGWLVGEGTVGAGSNTGFTAPNMGMTDPVLRNSSWHVDYIDYTTPEPGTHADYCFPGHNWVNQDNPVAPQVVLGANAAGRQGFSQPITETYRITVNAESAQGLYGGAIISRRLLGSRDEESEPWPQSTPPESLPDGTDTIGDSYEDSDDAERAIDLDIAYSIAAARIRGSLRSPSVVVRTDLSAGITLDKTVSVNCAGLETKGKIRKLEHRLAAVPYTEITIAVSRGGGGVTDPWTAPDRSAVPNDPKVYWEAFYGGPYVYPIPDPATTLATLIGNSDSSPTVPDPDDRENAWITNFTVSVGSPTPEQIYVEDFRVTWPGVESEAMSEIRVTSESSFRILVAHDTLVLS